MKYLSKEGLTYYHSKIKALLNGKVDKEEGKGLSTNDYTTTEKTKLSGIEEQAQKNVQADWEAESGDAFIKNKPEIPEGVIVESSMSDTSENAVQNKVIKKYVDDSIGGITKFDYQVVDELPATGKKGIIYLVPKAVTKTKNIYEEYIWVTDKYEMIGNTDVDMSQYYTKTETDDLLDEKVDVEEGKGLSTEDYTTNEKEKLASLPDEIIAITNAEIDEITA